MTPLTAVIYSFFFGLLHGVLPDEHTWPITFSYAVGGASGRKGMKAGLFFSAAFTVQRMLLSEVAYLALAPFLLNPNINGIVYLAVGAAMSIAGFLVIGKNRYVHLHLLGHHHRSEADMGRSVSGLLSAHHHEESSNDAGVPPIRWTMIHGFIAGFGLGGFSLFVNTIAAPAMQSAWLGFMPGLAFGIGTTIALVAIGYLFGASLRWFRLSERAIQQIGAKTGGRTLFFGGILFGIFGIVTLLGLDRNLPVDAGYALITLFMLFVAIPAFIFTAREVLAAERSAETAVI